MSHDDLLNKVLECPRLPSLPAIAIEVIELCRQDDINIRQIASTISNDPALSTKILKTVNSSFYGLSQPVSTITHALVILGLNSVKTLALGFSLVGSVKDLGDDDFDPNTVWKRSLYAAVAARSIAQHVGIAEHEEAFLGGLLQDLGVIAMIQAIGEDYTCLLKQIGDNHEALWKLERKEIAIDHCQVGEALAKKWKLPEILVAPIRHHENPEPAPSALRPMIQAVNLGAKAADVFITEKSIFVDDYFSTARNVFKLDQQEAADLLETINTGTQEMARLFDINCGPYKDAGNILADANETLLELSMKSQQEQAQLAEENKALEKKATTDALTGIANRGAFNDYFAEHFDDAIESGKPISYILFDVDKFKIFNDTHGHDAGDQVLIAMGETLRAQEPKDGMVARYGGEEFCVVLPRRTRREAAFFAEELRLAIEATEVKISEELTLSVTASFGVAAYEGVLFRAPEQLLKAADQAVYAAKGAGRNCVRIFAPRVRAAATAGT